MNNKSFDMTQQLLLETLEAAKQNVTKADFELHCKLRPNIAGVTLSDWTHMLDSLIFEHVIEVVDGRLCIDADQLIDKLKPLLIDGLEHAWKLYNELDVKTVKHSKFNSELLKFIGLEGEYAVVNQLAIELPESHHGLIHHTSLSNDCVGFDVSTPSVTDNEKVVHLEVKTTTNRSDTFRFFISRNEIEVATRSNNWYLVFVRKSANRCDILGHISIWSFFDLLPINQTEQIRWESLSVCIQRGQFKKGLP